MGKLTEITILLLLAGGVAVGFSTFYADMYTTYNASASPGSTAFLNKSVAIQSNITSIKNVIQNSQVTGTVADVFIIAANGILEGLKLAFSFIDIIDSFVTDISSILFLPEWATRMLVAAGAVYLLFAIMSVLAKYDT